MGTYVKRSNTTHVIMILDESGSMSPQWDDTIGGANAYVDKLKEDKMTNYRISLLKFDTEYRPICWDLPVSEVPRLDRTNYCPRGSTALYDAVGYALNQIESKVNDGEKAICVIITDGEENSSKEQTETTIRPRIETLQGRGNWTFVYLGAAANAWDNAQRMGLYKGNVRHYNKANTREVYAMMSNSTVDFAASSGSATVDYFSDFSDPNTTGIKDDSNDPK
jgi:Mg-chelatase subunit ChlD